MKLNHDISNIINDFVLQLKVSENNKKIKSMIRNETNIYENAYQIYWIYQTINNNSFNIHTTIYCSICGEMMRNRIGYYVCHCSLLRTHRFI